MRQKWVTGQCDKAFYEIKVLLAGHDIALMWDHWDKSHGRGGDAKSFLGIVTRLIDDGLPVEVYVSFAPTTEGTHAGTKEAVRDRLIAAGVHKDKLVYATTDNAGNSKDAQDHSACVQHDMNLAVVSSAEQGKGKGFLEFEDIVQYVMKFVYAIKLFARRTKARTLLKNLASQALHFPNSTRWWSHLTALKRALSMYRWINALVAVMHNDNPQRVRELREGHAVR